MHADLVNPAYVTWRGFLQASDHWDEHQISKYQYDQLRQTIEHAYSRTAGYRRLFDNHAVEPRSFRQIGDLVRFPFVTKEMVREQLADFSTADPDRSYVTTGGSTGIPFGFYRNAQTFARELASKAHQYARVGWREGDRQLVFRGIPLDRPDHVEYISEFEELRCSSYHLTERQMERYYQAAREYRPEWIRCYPSTGTVFADYLLANGLALEGVKGVLCASENLYDWQKERMQRAFGGRIFSHYGHYELAALAGYCEQRDTYHVLPQYGYAELIDEAGKPVTEPGGLGEIVATSFLMTNTPFIRYRTRDFAVLGDGYCDGCGRPFPVWTKIEGRLQEFIVTADGRHIPMTAVNMHDETFDAIRQFQFQQEKPGRLTLRYLPKVNCNAAALAEMVLRLRVKLGADMQIELEPVEEIALTGRGKHRFLIQRLPLRYGD